MACLGLVSVAMVLLMLATPPPKPKMALVEPPIQTIEYQAYLYGLIAGAWKSGEFSLSQTCDLYAQLEKTKPLGFVHFKAIIYNEIERQCKDENDNQNALPPNAPGDLSGTR